MVHTVAGCWEPGSSAEAKNRERAGAAGGRARCRAADSLMTLRLAGAGARRSHWQGPLTLAPAGSDSESGCAQGRRGPVPGTRVSSLAP